MKPERLLSENDLKLLVVDTIEQPKKQRDYFSGKKRTHTIKTEIVTYPKGRILRVSKPYEGRVHDFAIRKKRWPAASNSDLGRFGLPGPSKRTLGGPGKNTRSGSLPGSERDRNTKLARSRIVVEHTFAHLKKWAIGATRYRGHLDDYSQIFQTIAGIYNLAFDI